MTTIAQAGILGFGPSAGKGVGVAAGDWYRHKANSINIGPRDDTRMAPNEIGGVPVPSFAYKAGVDVVGGAEMSPRLENSIGWLLLGYFGDVSSVAGSGTLMHHTFKFLSTNLSYVPWMGVRKFIPPGSDAGEYGLGETYIDCKMVNLGLILPNTGLITARADWAGRSFSLEEDPNWGIVSGSTGGWATDGEYEGYESVPISSVIGGYIYEPTYGNLPVVQARIGFANTPLAPDREKVYGSPYREDITIVNRGINIALTVKWKNPDLYRKILTGDIDGTVWSGEVFTSSLEILSMSPGVITGTTTPYSLKLTANKVTFMPDGSPQLAGNDAIMQNFQCTVIDNDGGEYANVELTNEVADYTWPS